MPTRFNSLQRCQSASHSARYSSEKRLVRNPPHRAVLVRKVPIEPEAEGEDEDPTDEAGPVDHLIAPSSLTLQSLTQRSSIQKLVLG